MQREEGFVLKAEACVLRNLISLCTLFPQGAAASCLKITLELWVTSTEVQGGSEPSQAFLQQE